MGLNLSETQQKLDRLIHNISEKERVFTDMYFNPNPMEVSFTKYNEAGKLETVKMPNFAKLNSNFDNKLSSFTNIIQIEAFTNNTRTLMPNVAKHVFWEFEFDKKKPESKLIVQGVVRGRGINDHWCGVYFSYGNSGEIRNGISYSSDNNNNAPVSLTLNGCLENYNRTGKQPFKLGWNMKNNAAGRWADVFNPNSTDDGREHQTGSTVSIIEYI